MLHGWDSVVFSITMDERILIILTLGKHTVHHIIAGDFSLDALLLALFAWRKEFDDLCESSEVLPYDRNDGAVIYTHESL